MILNLQNYNLSLNLNDKTEEKKNSIFATMKNALSQLSNPDLYFTKNVMNNQNNKSKFFYRQKKYDPKILNDFQALNLDQVTPLENHAEKNEMLELSSSRPINNNQNLNRTFEKSIDALNEDNNEIQNFNERILLLEQENKKLIKEKDEIKCLLDLKNNLIKKLEENLSISKNELSNLKIINIQLKSDLDYFKKKPQKLNAIKTLTIKSNKGYFIEDESELYKQDIKEIEIDLQKIRQDENSEQIIKEIDLISCWFTQNKPYKFYMPKLTLILSQNSINITSINTSVLSLNCELKNNTSQNFEEFTIKINPSPCNIFFII